MTDLGDEKFGKIHKHRLMLSNQTGSHAQKNPVRRNIL